MAGFFMSKHRGVIEDPFDVKVEDFDLGMISRSLSRQCRFNGHGNAFISVAEHSVNVSYEVSPENAFVALMHDAPEMFVGDLHSEIKDAMHKRGETYFKTVENYLWILISHKYRLPMDMPDDVLQADMLVRHRELQRIFYPEESATPEILPVEADSLFLDRARELRPDLFTLEAAQ